MIQVDERSLSALEQKFLGLTTKKQNKVCKAALRRGANIILRESRKNLRARVKVKGIVYEHMYKGMQVSVKKDGSSATVSVYGSKKYTSSYVLRFHELGTDNREWKHRNAKSKTGGPAKLGAIKPMRFFADARVAKGVQAAEAVEKQMMSNIEKIWNKDGK